MRYFMIQYERLCVLFLLSTVFFTGSLYAHHILGLPHYSYKENYPQAPVLEYPAFSGPYEILLTCYPGKPVPGEAANLVFYVKDQQTGTPYEKSIDTRVLQTFTFGKSSEVLAPITVKPYEQPHKISVTFPDDGEYVIELSMEVEGKTEIIPFMLVVGNPSSAASILIAATVGLVIFIITIRAVKIKQKRRLNAKGNTDEVV